MSVTDDWTKETALLPRPVKRAVLEIARDEYMNEGLRVLKEREREFRTPMAAMLAGIALHPESRQHFDQRLDEMWEGAFLSRSLYADEVVIGGGLHAAIYCAVRVARGYAPPLVLEQRERVGGAFAVSRNPSFYLNSRNRPGDLSLPGEPGALNVLPGAPIQPSDIDGNEYQDNASLAWAIRASLAMNAQVLTNAPVSSIRDRTGTKGRGAERKTYSYLISVANNSVAKIFTNRIIIATGLATERNIEGGSAEKPDGERILTFNQFMKRMDSPFPLRGLKRVAVIGGGDSACTVIEGLTGQGPVPRWSVASIDYPEQIDWYSPKYIDRANWEAGCRPRYKGIGKLLPVSGADRRARIRPFAGAVTLISKGYDCVYVSERPYDCVVTCPGYALGNNVDVLAGVAYDIYRVGMRRVAARYGSYAIFRVGPAAALEVGESERAASPIGSKVPENSTALYRYADRTAALAASFS